MSDAQSAESQADAASQSQADASATNTEAKSVNDLPEWAQRLIKDTRKEAADFRTKLQRIEDKDKTEAERLASERDSLAEAVKAATGRARDKSGKASVFEAARAANAVSANAIYALVRDSIEYDDDDEPKNLDALISKAKKDEPSLFRAAPGSGDGGKGGDGKALDANQVMNDWLRSRHTA